VVKEAEALREQPSNKNKNKKKTRQRRKSSNVRVGGKERKKH
jgi:hypothetical protein